PRRSSDLARRWRRRAASARYSRSSASAASGSRPSSSSSSPVGWNGACAKTGLTAAMAHLFRWRGDVFPWMHTEVARLQAAGPLPEVAQRVAVLQSFRQSARDAFSEQVWRLQRRLHRGPAAPVRGAGPQPLQRGAMRRRAVALVLVEAV